MTAHPTVATACPAGVAPADVSAWALDGEVLERIDLAAHVPGCAVCRRTRVTVAPTRALASALEALPHAAPAHVSRQAAARIGFQDDAAAVAEVVLAAAGSLVDALCAYGPQPRHKGVRT